jgi:hypothetical protein
VKGHTTLHFNVCCQILPQQTGINKCFSSWMAHSRIICPQKMRIDQTDLAIPGAIRFDYSIKPASNVN